MKVAQKLFNAVGKKPPGLVPGANQAYRALTSTPKNLALKAAATAPLVRYNQKSQPELAPRWKEGVQKVKLTPSAQKRMPYDGATAAAYVAYAFSEQAFIYPITPATPMGDAFATWNAQGKKNLFGEVCEVTQMQSEGGAAGALHGVVDVGTLASTFTSSQGLLLMIPNMYILAGALNPCVIHVAARAITKHALCIFGDHTDVMACRQTGFAMLSAHNVQESMDMALCAHIATLKSSVPFINFFDGFRTSHEISKPAMLPYESMSQLVPWDELAKYRKMGLTPNRPHCRQQGQFSDTFFQNAEASNLYYDAVPNIVQETLDDIGQVTGRYYKLYQYAGHPEAENVIVSMGSSANVINEVVNYEMKEGRKIGQVKVHLFRPWDAQSFLESLPPTVKTITVLDRTKESGALGEPLFMDVASTMQTAEIPVKVVGGRYGLGSKDLTPGMVLAVYKNGDSEEPRNSFTVGIDDDVTFRSLPEEPEVITVPEGTKECMFWGMGSDGTLSANKTAIKIIGTQTEQHVQAHFVYDSKKAGGATVSHLRFGPERIESSYDIKSADYIASSQVGWIHKFKNEMWLHAKPGATVVMNCPHTSLEGVNNFLPAVMKRMAAEKDLQVYVIDANKVAKSCGLGRHTNNILTAVFFKLSQVLPVEDAILLLKDSMRKAYGAKGSDVVNRNLQGVDQALENLVKVEYPKAEWAKAEDAAEDLTGRPTFCVDVMDRISALNADKLPVSSFDARGHFPTGTTQYEKRAIALTVPVTDMNKCTQCNKCSLICPHAAIRPFLMTQVEADLAPNTFDMRNAKGGSETAGLMYRIQVAPDDCTGCQACSNTCGDGALTMTPLSQVQEVEQVNWDFAASLRDRGALVDKNTVKGSQFQKAYLEFSGACEGCGETPYAKLVTQLFGERLLIANASGCSSVWSGTAAFSPFPKNELGQGPAYGRSLFEDAAEYGLGMARSVNQKRGKLKRKVEVLLNEDENTMVRSLLPQRLQENLAQWLLHYENPDVCQNLATDIVTQLENTMVGNVKSTSSKKSMLSKANSLDMFNRPLVPTETSTAVLQNAPILKDIAGLKDNFIKTSCWVWGGDGWAFDIGFGGLDHVLAFSRGLNINILVMDTEGYSNTGGQISKATNIGSVQKFAPAGHRSNKKDLGAIAMAYEHIYVASISMGADYGQTVKALQEAEAYQGPSLILAYSPCIEHKILFPRGLSHLEDEMKQAVEAGYWSLYRFNPDLVLKGENPFKLDSKRITRQVDEFTSLENRFMTLERANPQIASALKEQLQDFVDRRHSNMKKTAAGEATEAVGTPITILVGSDTGTTIELAARLKKQCESRNYNVTVLELDEVTSIDDLQAMDNVLLLCATAGEGDMPGNSHNFWTMFEEGDFEPDTLKGMKFHTFGMGDRGYRHFNLAAKLIDEKFVELGAERMQEVGLGDDQDDDKYETALEEWLPEFWKIQKAPEPADAHLIAEPTVELIPQEASKWTYRQLLPPGTKLLNLEENKRITPMEHDRIIRHLTFDITGRDFSYLLGDALNIFAQNDPERIRTFLTSYGLDPDAVYQVNLAEGADKRRTTLYRRPLSVHQIFTEILDIEGRPNKFFYKELAKFAVDPAEKAKLELACADSEEGKKLYADFVAESVTYVDLLNQFPSAHPPLEHLMSMIPCIKPRLYSIASSQRYVNDKVELMIVINDWETPSGKYRVGTCTDYVERCSTDGNNLSFDVPCSVTTGTFNFPESFMQPMVMAGLGTGLAPFRAFIQERAHFKRMGHEGGPMWLFYGCRHKAKDYCFGDELEAYLEEGVITELRPAFSRDQKEKIYVQHKIIEVADRLYEEFEKKNGYFYLCGQAGAVETDIENGIKDGMVKGGGLSPEEAAARVESMHDEGRYNLELY